VAVRGTGDFGLIYRDTVTRRAFLRASGACGTALWVGKGAAQSVEVPVRLQVELLAKVAAYDRNFAERARGRAVVLIMVKPGDAASERVGEQIHDELSVLGEVGGLPHHEEMVSYSARRSVAALCRSYGAAVLYLSVGLTEEMPSIASALAEQSILTAAVTATYVQKGSVLGFDAESGRPRLVVNLTQARRQKVAFKPELLKLARVIP
jgi:hypothetical protein